MNDTVALSIAPDVCTIVVDRDVSIGHCANAATVLALTVGQRHPALVGEAWRDNSGASHPGLLTTRISILVASQEEMIELRKQTIPVGCDIIDFPDFARRTTNYSTFLENMTVLDPEEIYYVALALVGQRKQIGKLVRGMEPWMWMPMGVAQTNAISILSVGGVFAHLSSLEGKLGNGCTGTAPDPVR
jgi:hypothetical protein